LGIAWNLAKLEGKKEMNAEELTLFVGQRIVKLCVEVLNIVAW
jgi:hypothetical protein